MKKILLFIIALALVLCVFTVAASAEEVVTDELVTETVSEAISEAQTDAPEGSEESTSSTPAVQTTNHTLLTRVWEYIVKYKSEILGVTGDALILIGVMVLKGLFKRKTTDISIDIKGVKGDTSHTGAQQTAVVEAVNELIAGYNKMKEAYEKYEAVEDDRNRLVGAVMAQNTAILDMLRTVYANNKNLPQGVKDVVMLEYANIKKVLGDDKLLRAMVDSVHEKVNAGTEVTSEGKT